MSFYANDLRASQATFVEVTDAHARKEKTQARHGGFHRPTPHGSPPFRALR